MSEKRYPTRMHEVLGVEPYERFSVSSTTPWYGLWLFVDEYGDVREEGLKPPLNRVAVFLVNHPECIIREPRLSEEQVKKLHAALLLGFKWLTVNSVDELWLFGTKPRKFNLGWGESIAAAARIESEDNSDLSRLVSWSDPEPLDIVATLKAAGVEVEE